jgi:tetratricopeptide (TPR) repeat protein
MQKAADSMYTAEMLFMQEDYSAALNGDGINEGFLDIANTYGSIPQGKLAAHYAGICYMKLGEWDNALTYLQKYSARSGAPATVINAQNLGLQGDIYVQKGDYSRAAGLYDQAVKAGDNVLTTSYYLKKYALVNEKLGNNQAALDACYRIKTDYAGSLEARDIDKVIGRIEQK